MQTIPPFLVEYERLRVQHQAAWDALDGRRRLFLQGLAVTVVAIVWLTFQSLHSAAMNFPLVLGLVVLVVLVVMALGVQGKIARQQRLLAYYDQAKARAEGAKPDFPRTGTEAEQNLRPEKHLYERDLDLLGAESLFSLLATVRTGLGEHGLAQYLLEPATHAETLARQAAVQELLPQNELRERIALLGTSKFQQLSAGFFAEWMAEEVPIFSPVWRVALGLTAVANVALLLAGLTHLRTWGDLFPDLSAVLAVQGAICLFLRAQVLPLLKGGVRLEGNVKMLSEGLALLQAATLHAPKLVELQRLSREPAGAVRELARLQKQLAIVEQRPKEYFLLLSLLLAAGTQASISIATWKRRNAASMQNWLAAWGEFEALNALATYAFEHPENVWPELLPATHAPTFEAEALAHPLLPGAVANDVVLNQQTRFLLISGSNMSGKSTLMRSVGINAVLAYAGAPVRARALRLTPLALGAALALTDSLAEGKSKFLAEVQRLAHLVEMGKSAPVLFLVDEIFSGTNSADRKTAADAVLSALLANGAIGALSTHDLALTELATEANGGVNRHMASPDADDPLAFDYRLKDGVNRSSNAEAILRLMGLGWGSK